MQPHGRAYSLSEATFANASYHLHSALLLCDAFSSRFLTYKPDPFACINPPQRALQNTLHFYPVQLPLPDLRVRRGRSLPLCPPTYCSLLHRSTDPQSHKAK